MRCNSWITESDFTYLHYIHQISSIQALPTFQYLYIQEKEKLIHDFILYIWNFLHEWEAHTA